MKRRLYNILLVCVLMLCIFGWVRYYQTQKRLEQVSASLEIAIKTIDALAPFNIIPKIPSIELPDKSYTELSFEGK